MRLYRINKLAESDGAVIKKHDVLANSDQEAMRRAQEDPDCPTCEILRDGEPIGAILPTAGTSPDAR